MNREPRTPSARSERHRRPTDRHTRRIVKPKRLLRNLLSAATVIAVVSGVMSPVQAGAQTGYELVAHEGDLEPSSDGGIYFFDLDAGTAREVHPTGSTRRIHWTPDGDEVIFRDVGAIRAYRPESDSVRTVAERPGDFLDYPTLSPDGRLVTYSLFDADRGVTQLRIVNIDGSGDRLLQEDEVSIILDVSESWAPDSSYLVAASASGLGPTLRYSLQIIEASTGSTDIVALPPDAGNTPVVSPIEHEIAVASRTNGVMLVSPRGDVLRRLESAHRVESLLWSPDGTKIAGKSNSQLLLWDLSDASDEPTILLTFRDAGVEAVWNSVLGSWSPDGELIAFSEVRARPAPSQVYTVSVSTGTTVLHGPGNNPTFRPTPAPFVPPPLEVPAEDARPADDQIRRLYRAAFGRLPDEVGFNFWASQYREGRPLDAIASDFISSPEFADLFGLAPSDEEFVDALYRNVLDRVGDSGGTAFWLSQLENGTRRADVLVSFADSPENIAASNTSTPLPAEQARVLRLYRAVFGRLPDPQGFGFWVYQAAQGASLADIAAAFEASPEYSARYGTDPTDAELIDSLYRNVLGRAGDSEGTAFWLGQLAAGVSSTEVLIAFSESPENLERTGTSRA